MKYVSVYKDLIRKSYIHINAISFLCSGYLPISFIPPSQLNYMISQIKKVVTKTNPKYDLVMKRLHLFYDMKLVAFSIDNKSVLIIQFLAFLQPCGIYASPHDRLKHTR